MGMAGYGVVRIGMVWVNFPAIVGVPLPAVGHQRQWLPYKAVRALLSLLYSLVLGQLPLFATIATGPMTCEVTSFSYNLKAKTHALSLAHLVKFCLRMLTPDSTSIEGIKIYTMIYFKPKYASLWCLLYL